MVQRLMKPDDVPAAPPRPAAPPVRENLRGTLSPREREIVNLTAQDFKNADIAGRLTLSEQTVKNHQHRIFEKLGVSDRLEMVLHAMDHGLVGTTSIPPRN